MNKPQSKTNLVKYYLITENDVGMRLDNWLFKVCKGVPKSHIYRLLRSGQVRVDGHRVGQTYRLQLQDKIRLPPMRVSDAMDKKIVPEGKALPILYEDDDFMALNKPAGLAVHGGSGVSFGVIEQLRQQRKQVHFLELVHRLDRETSGILLVAKKRSALVALQQQLKQSEIEKHYLTLVKGCWQNNCQHIRFPLLKYLTAQGERRVRVDEQGKVAHSIVSLKHKGHELSLLDVQIKTGRTHQIRVHLSYLGFPLCGDEKYGDFQFNKLLHSKGLKRMFLHAERLKFIHPRSGDMMLLQAPLPKDLSHFLTQMEIEEN